MASFIWPPQAGGSGTVTSVALTAPGSILSVSGSPVTSAGTLALSLVTQSKNTVWAGPTTGSAANPTFRALVAADIPDLSATYIPVSSEGTVTELTSSVLTLTGWTDATIGSPTITVKQASGSQSGYLSSTDWSTFNSKQAALTIGNLTDAGTDGITITGGTGAVIGSGTSVSQHVADSTHNGYLSSTDWSTFNGKQASGNYITALTGDVTASGPGSVASSLVATSNATLTTLSALTSVSTITTGVWNGTAVAVPYGGTGLTTLTSGNVILGNGTSTPSFVAPSTSGNVLTSNGSTWISSAPASAPISSYEIYNLGLVVSVAASALTIAIKQYDASTDPASGAGAVTVAFRSTLSASGNIQVDSVTSATSLVVPSTATLGTTNGNQAYLYVYAVDAGGGVWVPAVSMTIFDEGSLHTTITIAGASNSAGALYATTGASARAVRLIGRLNVSETTAGTWATLPSEISLVPFEKFHPGAYGESQTPTGTITNSYNVVKFGTVTRDKYTNYSTSTGLFTVTEPGWYNVMGTLDVAGAYAVNGVLIASIYQNGSAVYYCACPAQVTQTEDLVALVTGSVYAAAGDTIGIYSYTTASSPSYSGAKTGSLFSIVWTAP